MDKLHKKVNKYIIHGYNTEIDLLDNRHSRVALMIEGKYLFRDWLKHIGLPLLLSARNLVPAVCCHIRNGSDPNSSWTLQCQKIWRKYLFVSIKNISYLCLHPPGNVHYEGCNKTWNNVDKWSVGFVLNLECN